MLDIGITELLVIGIVSLIVVGPKDLPVMFRTLGRFTGKMRSLARDFQRAMEDAADDAGMRDIQSDLKKMANPKRYGLDKLNEAAGAFEAWDPAASAKTGRPASATRPDGPATQAMAEERTARAAEIRDAAEARRPEASPAPAKTTGAAAETPLTEERDG